MKIAEILSVDKVVPEQSGKCMKTVLVLPVYNVAHYLMRCIDSLKAQTYADFTAVLVDDGSTDESGALCDQVAASDRRFVTVHQANGGVSAARNRGLVEARRLGATHLTFIDPDDWVHPDYLAELVKGLDLGVKLVCTGYQDVDPVRAPNPSGAADMRVMSTEDYWLGEEGMPRAPWGKLMAMALFEGVEFPIGRVHEDEARMARILFGTDHLAYLSRPLYYYWHREDSITRGSNDAHWTDRSLDHIQAVRDQIEFFSTVDRKRPLVAARRLMVTYCIRAIKDLGRTEYRQLLRKQLKALAWPVDWNEECFIVAYPVRALLRELLRKTWHLLKGGRH